MKTYTSSLPLLILSSAATLSSAFVLPQSQAQVAHSSSVLTELQDDPSSSALHIFNRGNNRNNRYGGNRGRGRRNDYYGDYYGRDDSSNMYDPYAPSTGRPYQEQYRHDGTIERKNFFQPMAVHRGTDPYREGGSLLWDPSWSRDKNGALAPQNYSSRNQYYAGGRGGGMMNNNNYSSYNRGSRNSRYGGRSSSYGGGGYGRGYEDYSYVRGQSDFNPNTNVRQPDFTSFRRQDSYRYDPAGYRYQENSYGRNNSYNSRGNRYGRNNSYNSRGNSRYGSNNNMSRRGYGSRDNFFPSPSPGRSMPMQSSGIMNNNNRMNSYYDYGNGNMYNEYGESSYYGNNNRIRGRSGGGGGGLFSFLNPKSVSSRYNGGVMGQQQGGGYYEEYY